MINIAVLLKDAPRGIKLYSPLFGEVEFVESESMITVKDINGVIHIFFPDGKFCNLTDAECLLFPSKYVRTWEGWKFPKPHYNIANFHAGMPVLVRWYDTGRWRYSLYSFYEEDSINTFDTVKGSFTQCIPFEGNEHLLGTTDMPDEEYINW